MDSAEPAVDPVQKHVVLFARKHRPAGLRQLGGSVSFGEQRHAAVAQAPDVQEEGDVAEIGPLLGGSGSLEQLRPRADAEPDRAEQLPLGA